MLAGSLNYQVFRRNVIQSNQVDRAKLAVFAMRGDRELSIREKYGALVCVVFVVKESRCDLAQPETGDEQDGHRKVNDLPHSVTKVCKMHNADWDKTRAFEIDG